MTPGEQKARMDASFAVVRGGDGTIYRVSSYGRAFDEKYGRAYPEAEAETKRRHFPWRLVILGAITAGLWAIVIGLGGGALYELLKWMDAFHG
jgi:hypothetical protein